MTTRQILDRAVERALNLDIRLAGQWDALPTLKGNEGILAQHLVTLTNGHADETRLRRILEESDSIDQIVAALERETIKPTVDRETGLLFV